MEQHDTGKGLVRVLARYAALPLTPERESAVATILATWIPAANELSRKMSTAAHQALVPITVLTHPSDGEEELR